jgi:hypothetical protein
MLNDISRSQLAGTWCAAIVLIAACGWVAGVALTIGRLELLLAIGVIPPAVMLLLWRGAPPVTVAEVLHAVNVSSKEGQSS